MIKKNNSISFGIKEGINDEITISCNGKVLHEFVDFVIISDTFILIIECL